MAIGGVLDPRYYSTKGAFNGTGIALAGESFVNKERGIITIYFQHHTGDIRWMQLNAKGNWIGGTKAETVATDAKNGSAISTVAYAMNTTSKWHIFYIDKNNTVRQKSNSNVTNIWEEGNLGKTKLPTALDANSVGMQACWYGNFYGDTQVHKFPTPTGTNASEENFSQHFGMNLWYAVDETTFNQYQIYDGADKWVQSDQVWRNMNGHAGVGCYSWLPGLVTYAMFVNNQNSVEFWWKDTNITLPSTESHPINVWKNGKEQCDIQLPEIRLTLS